MKLNDFRTNIIIAILRLKQASTTTLAHELFKPENKDDLKRQESRIRYNLNIMCDDELIIKNGAEYSMNNNRVNLTKAKLSLDNGIDIPMGTMLIIIPNDKGDIQLRQIQPKKLQ